MVLPENHFYNKTKQKITRWFYKIFKKFIISILHNFFFKKQIKNRYKFILGTSITLIPKVDKVSIKETGQYHS